MKAVLSKLIHDEEELFNMLDIEHYEPIISMEIFKDVEQAYKQQELSGYGGLLVFGSLALKGDVSLSTSLREAIEYMVVKIAAVYQNLNKYDLQILFDLLEWKDFGLAPWLVEELQVVFKPLK